MLVGAVVVSNEMQRQFARRFRVQLLEEAQPLPVSVLGGGRAEYLAIQIREGREERDGPMPLVIMGSCAGMPAF